MQGVRKALFAERFAADSPGDIDGTDEAGVYDATRQYTVTADGVPVVDLGVVGSTNTFTAVTAESPDNDRDWEQTLASIDTQTRADRDREHWDVER